MHNAYHVHPGKPGRVRKPFKEQYSTETKRLQAIARRDRRNAAFWR